MPLYDYKCDGCQHCFEVSHAMAAPAIKVCPECGKKRVRKVLSTGGVLNSSKGGQDASPPSGPCASMGGGCAGGMCPM
ncbi:MAG: zinc ribbon domain-containing protein [Magnetococcales bacterium]|nr:zinc ribbon domain-containing protein [Magnetococcales bacterium]